MTKKSRLIMTTCRLDNINSQSFVTQKKNKYILSSYSHMLILNPQYGGKSVNPKPAQIKVSLTDHDPHPIESHKAVDLSRPVLFSNNYDNACSFTFKVSLSKKKQAVNTFRENSTLQEALERLIYLITRDLVESMETKLSSWII